MDGIMKVSLEIKRPIVEIYKGPLQLANQFSHKINPNPGISSVCSAPFPRRYSSQALVGYHASRKETQRYYGTSARYREC